MLEWERHLDIIVPCYNEENCIPLFFQAVDAVMAPLDYCYTILFVDDGSTDNTMGAIRALKVHYPGRIRFLSFSRNFGKEAAIFAGLSAAEHDLAVIMDCDLQDPPELLPEMLQAIESGYDCCAAVRKDRRGEPPVRSFFAKLFYHVMNRVSDVKIEPGARDFRLLTRPVIDAVLALKERERFSKGLFSWVGFRTKALEYIHQDRAAGQTKWSFWGLMRYGFGGIVAFTTAPLKLGILLGAFVVLGSFCYGLYIFMSVLLFGIEVPGYASLLLFTIFLCGVIILLLGVIGEYLSKIYLEVKGRPLYVIQEKDDKVAKGPEEQQ